MAVKARNFSSLEAGLWIFGVLLSMFLVWGAAIHRLGFSQTEVFAFITGAIGVALTVKQNIWNFPIGLANNLFFGVLFWENEISRADY